MPKQRKHPKTFRKFGPVTVTSGKDVKTIRSEQWVRTNRVTGECLVDEDGFLITSKVDKVGKIPVLK